MNPIKILKVTRPEEYALSLEIRRQVFIEEQQVPTDQEIDTLRGENFLIYLEQAPVGTARYQVQNGLVKFERVAVLKEHRGKGLGKALMLTMQKEAESQYPDHLQVMQAQISAIPFYEKMEWVAIGDFFLDAGIEHRWMVFPPKSLKNLICKDHPKTPLEIKNYLNHLYP